MRKMVDSKCPCDAMIFHSTEGMFFCTLSSKKAIAISSLYDYEQSSSSDFVNFTFTGKEKDEETGYGYFGARYMDHELMTMWLSVDPLSDKYPNISPYAYCAWNPVKLVDPDGRDVWELTENGELVWMSSSKEETIQMGSHSITNKDKCVFGHSDKPKTINLSENNWSFGTDDRHAEMYFEFFADHLNYEFSLLGYEGDNGMEFMVTTWLDPDRDENGRVKSESLGSKLKVHVHNHPNGIADPSTPDNHKGPGNDKDFREGIIKQSPQCEFFIYTKSAGGSYSRYNGDGRQGDAIPSRFNKKYSYGWQRDNFTGWLRPSPLFDSRYN